MIPAGYMAKRVSTRAEWLKAPQVVDIYSVSACESACFGDFLEHWKHNGHWLFDSPALLQEVARADGIALSETKLFYYEVHEFEFDDRDARRPAIWSPLEARMSLASNVVVPAEKALEGYDVTTFQNGNSPECSPLSCNSLAEEVPTNQHCLLASFEQAHRLLEAGTFKNSEPGPFRILAVYSTPWPGLPQ